MRVWQTRALALTLGFSLALSGSGIQGVPLVKVERASAAENGSQSRASSSTKVTMWNNDTYWIGNRDLIIVLPIY